MSAQSTAQPGGLLLRGPELRADKWGSGIDVTHKNKNDALECLDSRTEVDTPFSAKCRPNSGRASQLSEQKSGQSAPERDRLRPGISGLEPSEVWAKVARFGSYHPMHRSSQCPSCGGTLHFDSSIALSAVCPYCQSLVIRRDWDVETLGSLAQLPPDLSPLQIGTTGVYQNCGFRLLGRLRWHWSGGSWTEWFAEMADGTTGWLAESQGFFALSRETQLPSAEQPSPFDLEPGKTLNLGGASYSVIDVKETRCLGGEGQLPEPVPQDSMRRSVDLQGPGRQFACIEFQQDHTSFFEGQTGFFADFKFGNLRPVPGWGGEPPPTTQSARFSCSQCGAPIQIRAAGLSMSCVCGSCGSIIDASDERHRLLETARRKLSQFEPILPIGRRGTFRGHEYEVIGAILRTDSNAPWTEHLLFNPWEGFRWLLFFQGHWTWVERLLDSPGSVQAPFGHFKHFASYETQIRAVLGEFYWQTSTAEITCVSDAIAPPFVLSRETYPELQEVTWSRGEYVFGTEVKTAFALESIPAAEGIALNEPNPFPARWKSLRGVFSTAVLLLGLIQAGFALSSASRQITQLKDVYRRSDVEKIFTSPPFTLPEGSGKVGIEAFAPVSNNWLDLNVALIETRSERRYEQRLSLGFFSRFDSDGSWTEGSQTKSESMAAVPAGQYRLSVETSADPGIVELPFTVVVRRGGLFWSNFWMALGLICVYPAWILYRGHGFESRRWAQSDHGPGATS